MGRIYLAGKIGGGETDVDQLAHELEERGHEITYKWWQQSILPTPYLSHIESSQPAADDMIAAVKAADMAVVLFPGPTILGAAVEFGIALGSQELYPSREVIVVGASSTRQSVFYAASLVIAAVNLDDIRQRGWY